MRPAEGSHYHPPKPRGCAPLPLPPGSEEEWGEGVFVSGAFKPREERTPKSWRMGKGTFSVIRGSPSWG